MRSRERSLGQSGTGYARHVLCRSDPEESPESARYQVCEKASLGSSALVPSTAAALPEAIT